MRQRRSGILMHISSLPGPFGVGDLGPWAYRLADLLANSGQSLWQFLPLGPTVEAANYSPYSATSAFAGNPMLISPQLLVEDGLLDAGEIADPPSFPPDRVHFGRAARYKSGLLRRAFDRFRQRGPDEQYLCFCARHRAWLDDFARFQAIRQSRNGQLWTAWPGPLRNRRAEAIRQADHDLRELIEQSKFNQFIFFRQWDQLRGYCHQRQIQLFGDVPIYVVHDSADVWAHPEVFQLGPDKNPAFVSGMPATRFAEQGQRWGMPLYDWERLRGRGYDWWLHRMGHNLQLVDWLRFDHYLGLVKYWRIPADADSPLTGEWVAGPRDDFLRALFRRFSGMPFVAEDLGWSSAESRELLRQFELPGMRVLVDAFGQDPGLKYFQPHNYPPHCAAYTSTHDNNTARGWFQRASRADRGRFFEYIGRAIPDDQVHVQFMRLVLGSAANVAMTAMQDVVGLGWPARMNRPGQSRGNWKWRLQAEQLDGDDVDRLADLTQLFQRR